MCGRWRNTIYYIYMVTPPPRAYLSSLLVESVKSTSSLLVEGVKSTPCASFIYIYMCILICIHVCVFVCTYTEM